MSQLFRKFYTVFFTLLLPATFLVNAQTKSRKTDSAIYAPPKGWNSWLSYARYPTERAMFANLETMAKRLKPFGYTYLVIDAGWNVEKDDAGNLGKMAMDNYGRYIEAKTAFPNGLKAVADKAHQLGLKLGIHIMRGIPREAYRSSLPVLGTRYTAHDIADTTSLCTWNSENYGVDMKKAGAQAYYDSFIGQLVNWGVDFIKADDITGHPAEVEAIKAAIKKTGKKIIFSLSPGENADTKNASAYNEADMLRITADVWDNQKALTRAFVGWKKWADVPDRSFWLDMDLIPFGHLCINYQNPNSTNQDTVSKRLKYSNGNDRMSLLSADQKYTLITIRALSASPLFMSGDLPTSDEFSFKLITNKDVLACNQNGMTGKQVYSNEKIEIWKTPNKVNPNEGWIGIFNRDEKVAKVVQLTSTDLGSQNKTVNLYDVWNEKGIKKIDNSPVELQVNANGVLFCHYKIN